MTKKPGQDVMTFLTRCGEIVAQDAEDTFTQNIYHEWLDQEVTSPIEQLLYAALHLVRQIKTVQDIATNHSRAAEEITRPPRRTSAPS